MSEIKKGIPIPSDLKDRTTAVGGHTPTYPLRDMDPGDYLEIEIVDYDQRAKALQAIRNARKARPKWIFVWKYGKSEDEKVLKAKPHQQFIKVWRKK